MSRSARSDHAEVTERLADRAYEALEILLAGFEAAAERDGGRRLSRLVRSQTRAIDAGLLTVLLRLTFVIYAEDRGLLPTDDPTYRGRYCVLELAAELRRDARSGAMAGRFRAWSRLLASWRAIHAGADEARLHMPARGGELFDPEVHPFLEEIAVDDATLDRALGHLLVLRDRDLEVEQLGSMYEALMGYGAVVLEHSAVRVRARRAKGVWLSAEDVLAVAPPRRRRWLEREVGLDKPTVTKLTKALAAAIEALPDSAGEAERRDAALRVLEALGPRADAGRWVIQPGDARRRTSSHYTPRALTEPVVRRTLAPLLQPTSEALLALKIVDPAMGSGAFLVEVVRQLGDHVVAAWAREGAQRGRARRRGPPSGRQALRPWRRREPPSGGLGQALDVAGHDVPRRVLRVRRSCAALRRLAGWARPRADPRVRLAK